MEINIIFKRTADGTKFNEDYGAQKRGVFFVALILRHLWGLGCILSKIFACN
jgi:hypothetical protein